ncbi:uncharacterized protein K460DRAFT_409044 [Cucurbitaria berberidis CBS 394.84]|uniref:Uncharacterized protein n=1 Tax=Cucurbitaria berberidis CBS 394.84 TaxID=1168544 RepID=A0A9P4GAB2_9PLEO|nr:uncharacterized protein K460DRAFT_409044 [Cucurbitaria berberidis CBS 394.84]KAF1841585.1 hypothetical protein K460DRAFT_409044 [Cucurbitaria berberidis CBS 394.84]
MGDITGTATDGLTAVETTARSSVTASRVEAGNGGRWVAIEEGGKLFMKKSFFKMPRIPRNGEPGRPPRPAAQKAFGPSLYSELARCYTWGEWAELYIEELERKMADGSIERALQRTRAADEMTTLHQEYKQKLHIAQTSSLATMEQESERRMQEANAKLTSLMKREKDPKVAEAKVRRMQAELKTYQDLSDAVEHMGDKIEKAVREMRTLTAGKSRPQQAFDRWEKLYCEPSIRVVDLNRQMRKDRDKNQLEHIEKVKTLQGREEMVSKLTIQGVLEVALLEKQRQDFDAEVEKWRIQKGQELSESEQKDIMEA